MCDGVDSGDCGAPFYVGILIQALEKMEAERAVMKAVMEKEEGKKL